MSNKNLSNLTDQELYKLCQEYGMNARAWQRKFADLLPEVECRRLHRKHRFHSLYEFASRLAGMSHSAVDEILNVHKKLQDKPMLRELMSEEGWGKLRVVSTIATADTQEFWAEKVKTMSMSTLRTFVNEIKNSTEESEKLGIDSSTPFKTSQKSAITFKIDAETETQLRIYKQKIEKKLHEPVEWNTVFKHLLKSAQQKKQQSKNQISPKKIKATLPVQDKRHIPARVKRSLTQKYKGKCAKPECRKPATIYHHTRRFALVPNHDPNFIAPLCKSHERVAHHGLYENEESAPNNWRIRANPIKNSPKFAIDQIVNSWRIAPRPP